jgi:hypothetical protein
VNSQVVAFFSPSQLLIPAIAIVLPGLLVGCVIAARVTHRLNLGHPKPNSILPKPMPNYRRPYTPGGTYFITQVTSQRQPWLCTELGRSALRHALRHVQQQRLHSLQPGEA